MNLSEISWDLDDQVATLTLNRPAKLNAWTQVMENEVRTVLTSAAEDPAVRVIIVTGAGRGFCGGADFGALKRVADTGADPSQQTGVTCSHTRGLDASYSKRFSYMLRIAKPIIAAINGPVVGIGFCFTLFCDIRFMAAGARLSTIFAERGLVAEHGSAWMLPRLVGTMNALHLLYSCELIGAEEAEKMGLVRALPEEGFLQAVRAFASRIAARSSPRSLAVIKRQVYDGLMQSLAESAEFGDEEMRKSFQTEDFREGVAHFVEKRPARFVGR